MKNKPATVFALYKAKKDVVDLEVARREKPYREDLATLKTIINDGNLPELIRDTFVSEGSGLDKLLSFLGFKSLSQQTQDDKLNSAYRPTQPRSIKDRILAGVESFFTETSQFLQDPSRGGLLWQYIRPILIASLLDVTRSTLHRGIARIVRAPFSLLFGKRKRK